MIPSAEHAPFARYDVYIYAFSVFLDLSRTLRNTQFQVVSERRCRELMVYHSHDSYLIIGEVREACGTPITGFYGVESNDFSLSRLLLSCLVWIL